MPIKKEENGNASITLLNGLSTKPKGKKRKRASGEDDEHKQKLLKKEEVCLSYRFGKQFIIITFIGESLQKC